MTVYKGQAGTDALRAKIDAQCKAVVKNIASELVENLVEHGQAYIGQTEYAGVVFPENDPGRFVNSWYTGNSPSSGYKRGGDASGGDSIAQAQFLQVDLSKNTYVVNSTPEAIYIEELGWTIKDLPSREELKWKDKSPKAPVANVSKMVDQIAKDAIEEAKKIK